MASEPVDLSKRRSSESIIPSLLLVNEDIISPIKVVFEATECMVSSRDKETADSGSAQSQHKAVSEKKLTKNEKSHRIQHQKKSFLNETSFDGSVLYHAAGSSDTSTTNSLGTRSRRRKSDCPARDQSSALLGIRNELETETSIKGNFRIKAKSIERAIDVEKSDVISQGNLLLD